MQSSQFGWNFHALFPCKLTVRKKELEKKHAHTFLCQDSKVVAKSAVAVHARSLCLTMLGCLTYY
jgi:hypothetical protein